MKAELLMLKSLAFSTVSTALLLAPYPLQADTVVTSVTCSANGLSSLTQTSNCTQNTPSGDLAAASASASLTVSSSSLTANITTRTTANVVLPPTPAIPTNQSSASATANVSATLTTSGAIRNGDITITFPIASGNQVPGGQGSSSGWSDTTQFSIGSLQGSCQSASATESCHIGNVQLNGQPYTVPFTLGQVFTFSYSTTNSALSNFNNGGPVGGTFIANLSFSVRDASGAPVALADVPEPSTWFLVLLPLAGLLLLTKMRRHGC